ncbi:MAG: hypothetical protein ACI9W4_001158 [Rhodothermales bacterium]|jgi:hypothetical protein
MKLLMIFATTLLGLGCHADPVWSPDSMGTPQSADYAAAFTNVLKDVLTPEGLVHYDRLVEHPEWPSVVKGIEEFNFSLDAPDAEKLAFWLNAYNVHMLNKVSQRPGRSSVTGLDDGRIFFKSDVRAGGQTLTLDMIEHGIIREGEEAFARLRPAQFDPRVHVALNCAALSCPRLWPEAFRAADLDAQLDRAMREFVNSPRHFRVEDGRLVASRLLDWFGEDFDRAGKPAGDFLLDYLDPNRPDAAEMRGLLEGRTAKELARDGAKFEYDWTVNRAG